MEKKGLGRGLGALIPGAGREDRSIVELPVERISANPYQPRKAIDDGKFEELVRSVRLHGILQPIIVRSSGADGYELVAGERRLRAAEKAGLTRIPAVVKEFTNEQSLEVALIENLQREDIGPLEAAGAYRRLVDEFGLTQDEIAFRLGKSRPSIANTLRLLNLPEEIQRSLSSGEISEGHARALLGVSDGERQRKVWRSAVDGGLTVRQTERLCRESSGNVSRETLPDAEPPGVSQDPNIVATEAELRQLLGTKVSIRIGRDRGRIEIEFYSEDDLNRILGLLGAI
ncbi:MAG: ParB/RepB/Spo0J family partition protein [Armatimonadetes bacterium]|nr:ParB/RepB/Spo0J family partition protein [Armatimonadota bacterium]